ncbi:MAG: hypothetical protein EOM54_08740 [Clostridia bacterium]|nr:hypothetical protein [Clostridia bacterium]
MASAYHERRAPTSLFCCGAVNTRKHQEKPRRMFPMKAVIMAGGEGTRLRPLSLGRPKPMTMLFDKPVLEHIIALLRRCGVTDICITLQYMPELVTDYFEDGSRLGVSLTYFVEQEPLGTAGSVKACMPHLGQEDFLVLSGDAVCDIDLAAAADFHRKRHSSATLVLCRHPNPLEYGLVLTDAEGRVERFIEKPSWGQVVASTVNTGIYVLTANAMDQVPENQFYDFGKELFPALLAGGEPLYGYVTDGYWRDMGDCRAYLDCAADALSGKVKLDLGLPALSPGVWSASPIPEHVTVVPPCWIGEGVGIGEGSLIGPHTVLGAGSSVGKGCLVQRSVLQQAKAGDRTTLYGAVLCPNSSARKGAVLNEGTVLGEDSVAEENAVLMEGVKLWPGRHASKGCRLSVSLTGRGWQQPPGFGDGGVLQGIINEDITPQLMLQLGGALGAEGKVGLGWSGGEGAGMLARAAAAGIASAGGHVFAHDATTAAGAAWLAERYTLPVSLFLEQEGERVYLSCFDRRGLPLERGRQRKLEGAVLRSEIIRVSGSRAGHWEPVVGITAAYAADAAHRVRFGQLPLQPVMVAVPQNTPADRLLVQGLELLGCIVLREKRPGVASFSADHGGRRLLAWDEDGTPLTPEGLLTLLCLIEFENGGGRVAVLPSAPAAIETMEAAQGKDILRLGRDGAEAEELYRQLPWLRDALFAACRICAKMAVSEQRLKVLISRIPRVILRRREIPLRGSRGAIMEALAGQQGVSQGEGLRLRMGEGWVYIVPLVRRSALRVVGESYNAELAAELCDFYIKKVTQMDKHMGDTP